MVSIPCTVSSLPYRSFVTELSPSFFPRFPPSVHPLVASVPYRSFPPELSPNYFTRFPFRPLSSLPYRSFPPKLSPSYFPRLPFRPPCRHSRISLLPVVIPVPLLPTEALPKLFPTASLPSTLCRHSRIAPSHRSSLQAISDGFPSVHPVVTPVSLLPAGALPKLFPTASSACASPFPVSSAGPRKSYSCGCTGALPTADFPADFPNFGASHAPASKMIIFSLWRRDRLWSCNSRRCCA